MKPAWKSVSVLPLLVALAACSSDQPLAPGVRSISGHLRLTGYLVDPDARFAGTLVVGDIDGIPVELLYGSQVVARTTTVDGVYRFGGLRPGGYVARSRIIPGIEDETRPLTVADADVQAADTLRLQSLGDLFPVPNPFSDTARVYFQVYDTALVELALRDIEGRKVRTLLDLELRPALHTVIWTMRAPASGGPAEVPYWLTFNSGPDVRAQLLLWRRPSLEAASHAR